MLAHDAARRRSSSSSQTLNWFALVAAQSHGQDQPLRFHLLHPHRPARRARRRRPDPARRRHRARVPRALLGGLPPRGRVLRDLLALPRRGVGRHVRGVDALLVVGAAGVGPSAASGSRLGSSRSLRLRSAPRRSPSLHLAQRRRRGYTPQAPTPCGRRGCFSSGARPPGALLRFRGRRERRRGLWPAQPGRTTSHDPRSAAQGPRPAIGEPRPTDHVSTVPGARRPKSCRWNASRTRRSRRRRRRRCRAAGGRPRPRRSGPSSGS